MKLFPRLLFAFSAAAILVAVVGYTLYDLNGRTEDALRRVSTYSVNQLNQAANAQLALISVHTGLSLILAESNANADSEGFDARGRNVSAALGNAEQHLQWGLESAVAEHEAGVLDDEKTVVEDEVAAAEGLIRQFRTLRQLSERVVVLSETDPRAAQSLFDGRIGPIYRDGLMAGLDRTMVDARAEFTQEIQRSSDRSRKAEVAALIVFLLPFLAALLVGLFIAVPISRRLGHLVSVSRAFGSGDLSKRVEVTGRDEISQLEQSINEMADALSASMITQAHVTSILNSIPDPVGVIDLDGNISDLNEAATRFIGASKGEVMHKPAITLFQDKETELAEFFSELSGSTHVSGYETTYRRPDGEMVPIVISASKLTSNGDEVTGLVLVVRDTTEAKRSEAILIDAKLDAEEAARAKSEFLANMSHEIRTPLNGIIGMTGFLLETELDDEQDEYATVIQTSGESLLTIINHILDFSKIEAGMLELEEQPFALYECIEEALDLVSFHATEKRIELAYLLEETVPVGVHGDPARLRQVLVNLLANAVKFTDQGEVIVHVGLEALDDAGCVPLHIRVSDTGNGIPSDRLESVFEVFTQADPSTTRRYGGTGLGLAITRRLIESMGGRIWAESTVGIGSTFHIILPLEPAAIRGGSPDCPGLEDLRGRSMLVVDDNATNRRILTLQGDKWGIAVTAVSSAREALIAIDAGGSYDLALLDYHMPETDGLQLARLVRERVPNMPLVMLSSLSHQPAAAADLLDGYLSKPIKQGQLCRVVVDTLAAAGDCERPRSKVESGGDTARPSIAAETTEPTMPAQLRILVAEDNPVNQRVMTLVLDRIGFKATMVADGQEAVDTVRSGAYDVVLMDIRMPRMDGIEAARQMRGDRSLSTQPTIIAMTADVTQQKREACFEAGMDAFLCKPIQRDELSAVLHRLAVSKEVAERLPLPEAPQRPPAPEQEGFDRTMYLINGMIGDDSAQALDFIRASKDNLVGEVLSLRDALKENDLGAAGRAGHSLKSVSACIGLDSLANECELVQRACDAKDIQAAVSTFLRMKAAVLSATELLSRVESAIGTEGTALAPADQGQPAMVAVC